MGSRKNVFSGKKRLCLGWKGKVCLIEEEEERGCLEGSKSCV